MVGLSQQQYNSNFLLGYLLCIQLRLKGLMLPMVVCILQLHRLDLTITDGVQLTRWDLTDAGIALMGMAVIMLQPEIHS